MTDKILILIPSRFASTRLPGKPLADIHGKPMIVHVAERAHAAKLGPVIVATDDVRIKQAVENFGFKAIITSKNHESGSDRIFEALQEFDKAQKYQSIINVQGDLPTVNSQDIKAALKPLENIEVEIATLGVEITKEEEKTNPNIVKIVGSPIQQNRLRALYFTRANAPFGEGPSYHHIGLYAYRRTALTKFINLPVSFLERREKLEQLRALEASMRIDVEVIKTIPLGVDTQDDLELARNLLKGN